MGQASLYATRPMARNKVRGTALGDGGPVRDRSPRGCTLPIALSGGAWGQHPGTARGGRGGPHCFSKAPGPRLRLPFQEAIRRLPVNLLVLLVVG